jgi:hypothetical protein
MSMKFRNVLAVAIATSALAMSTGAVAASVTDKIGGKLRDQQAEQQKDSGRSNASGPRSDAAPAAAPAPRSDRPRDTFGGMAPAPRDNGNSRGNGSSNAPRGNSQGNAQGNGQGNRPGNAQGNSRGNARGDNRGNDRPAGPVQGNRGPTRDLNDSLGRVYGNDRGNDRGSSHNPRPPRVITRLPDGHRDYYWNGNRYYFHSGHWYRPYGSSFVTVGVPFGLFVGTLPGIYSSFWYGGTRYFYSDNVYYEYEPVRRGYVVVRSPYGDDEEDEYDSVDGDGLYIYPARGQSEQQQADDRYSCHRWAAQESRYDPLDDEFDAQLRKEYQRAMTACLTGRGYTVN